MNSIVIARIIRGLEAILEETADMFYRSIIQDALALLKAQKQKCRECGEATSKAIQELQAKLKAQEPRVMTFDEVRDEADHMYLEKHSKTGSDLYGCAIRGDWDGYGIELLMSEYDTARERWSDYGKTWRCWTSCPDEKRRAETPWQQ